MKIEKLICIHIKTEETQNCETCCGITNMCGLYENKLGIDPFKDKYKKIRNWEDYYDIKI